MLIRGARQLITLRGSAAPRRGAAANSLGVIEDGAVLIENGLIREVGPTRRVENLAEARRAETTIDARGCVVMPGFVDCHAHFISGPRRLLAGDGSSDSMMRAVHAVRDTPAGSLKAEGERMVAVASRFGTTTAAAISGYALSETGELKLLRAAASISPAPVQLVPSYFGANAAPPEFEWNPSAYIDGVCSSTLPLVARRKLARSMHVACGEAGFSSEDCLRALAGGRRYRLASRVEFAQFGRKWPLKDLLAIDLASVDHLEHATEEDVTSVARSSSTAVLVPATAFARGSSQAPGRALADAGAAVALGSDYNRATTPCPNMQFTIYLACHQMGLTVEEAVTAATLNAAHVLGLGKDRGSLQPGKRADIILLHTGNCRALASEFGANLVKMTIQGGNIVFRGFETA